MTHARRVVISVLWAVLSAPPLIRSQVANAPKANLLLKRPLPIRPLGPEPPRGLNGVVSAAPTSRATNSPRPGMRVESVSNLRRTQAMAVAV